ncbi:hypothetical protein J6590_073054 [Homalodisca vitripennis]|nr:hypothetical protein J6590_073054 [Homalodisca vitripennis]
MKKLKLTQTSSSLVKSPAKKSSKKQKQDTSVLKHNTLIGSHSNPISNKYYSSSKSFLSPLKETKRRQQKKKSANFSEDTKSNKVNEKCVKPKHNSTLSTSKVCKKTKHKKFILQEWKYKKIDSYLMKRYGKPSEPSQLSSHKTDAIIGKCNENPETVPTKKLMQKIIEDCISESNTKKASVYGGTSSKTTFTYKSNVEYNNTSFNIEVNSCEGRSTLTLEENNPMFDSIVINEESDMSHHKDFTDEMSSITNDSPNNISDDIEVKSCEDTLTLTVEENNPIFDSIVDNEESDMSHHKDFTDEMSSITNDSPNNISDGIEVKSCEDTSTLTVEGNNPIFDSIVDNEESDMSHHKDFTGEMSSITNDSPNNISDDIEVKSCEDTLTLTVEENNPIFDSIVDNEESDMSHHKDFTDEMSSITNDSPNNISDGIEVKSCEDTSTLTVEENNPIFDSIVDNEESDMSHHKDFTDEISSIKNDSPNNTADNIEICEQFCEENLTVTEHESRPPFKNSVGTRDSAEPSVVENNVILNDTSDDMKVDGNCCKQNFSNNILTAQNPPSKNSVDTKDSDEYQDSVDKVPATLEEFVNIPDDTKVCEKSCEENMSSRIIMVVPDHIQSVGNPVDMQKPKESLVKDPVSEISAVAEDSINESIDESVIETKQEISESNKNLYVENEDLSQRDRCDQCTSVESSTSPSAIVTPIKNEKCSNNINNKISTEQTNWFFPKIKFISQSKSQGKTCSSTNSKGKVKSKQKQEEKTKNENSNQHKLKKSSPIKIDDVKIMHNIDHYFAPIVKNSTSCKDFGDERTSAEKSEKGALASVVESSHLKTVSLHRNIEKRPLNEVNCNIITNMCKVSKL